MRPQARAAACELTPIIERIFRDIRDGDTPGKVARALNRDGVPGPQGGQWSAKAVHRIASNPAYAGERYGVKGAHPAIISRRAFNAAARSIETRKRPSEPQG